MKKSIIIVSFLALVAASCSKENQVVVNNSENNVAELVPMTFSANLPETRTVLNDHKVIWSADDMLNVIEVDAEGNLVGEHPFTLSGGDGTNSATFTGEVVSGSNSFYAVYPNQKLYNSPETVGQTIELKTLGQAVDAVENGYDPKMAVMTAVVDESGNLAFRHAMAYIKFTANSSDIASVKVTASGDARIYGRPVINVEDGTPNTVSGTSGNSNLIMSGSFVSGSAYYFPITIKPGKKLGELTFLATNSAGAASTVSTTSLSALVPEAGKVYNLGLIPFSYTPSITFTAPGKLEYDATSGSFAYSVKNPVEGETVAATLEDGVDWISNIVVGEDAVTFDCEVNKTDEERSAVITLSYEGAEDVEVTVIQKSNGTPTTVTYTWDFQSWKLKSGTVSADYYYYDSENQVFAESATASEPERLYFTKSLAVASGSGWYYANMSSGGANYSIVIPTTKSGILTLWATTNKKETESGNGNLEVHYGSGKQTAALSVADGNYYDTSAELCNAKPFEFTIDGTESLIQIYKSGSNGIRIYKVEFVANN